ncbi:MAG: hypothetical protein KBS63_01510 [Clostridiales bacterium]|nr:hypothetical protein [Candidatus Crickella caballi]
MTYTGASVAVLKASMASKLWEAIGSSLVCYASLASFRSHITITKTKTYY